MKILLVVWITVFITAIVVTLSVDAAIQHNLIREYTEQCKEGKFTDKIISI